MADREFKVLITGDASSLTAASKEGAAALSQVADEAKGNASALQDDLNPAVESFKKSWKGAAQETEEFAKKGELKHMVRELMHDFPLLGTLAKAALNPILGAFGLLLVVLKWIHEIFQGIIEASSQGIFSGTFRRNVDEASKAALDGELAFRSYQRALEGVAKAHDSAAQKAKDETTAIHEHAVAVAELDNAQKAMELARVNMLEKQGRIDQDKAVQMRLDIEDKYARLKLSAEVDAKEAEIAAKRKERDRLERSAGFEEQGAEQAKKDMDEAESRLAAFKALQEGTKKALEDTNKQVKSLVGMPLQGAGWAQQYRTARALQEQLEQRAGLMKGGEFGYADAAREARERFEQSSSRAKELHGSAADLTNQLPGEQARANQSYIDAGNVAAAERLTRTYTAAGEMAEKADNTLDGIDKNIATGHMILEKTVKVLEQQQKGADALNARVERLESQMKHGTRPLQ